MHKWKMGQYSDPEMKKRREAAVSTDPKVMALLADGIEAFGARLSDRVLEHCDDVFLNYCPRCGALTKTPTAKQCPKCFFSWHDDV